VSRSFIRDDNIEAEEVRHAEARHRRASLSENRAMALSGHKRSSSFRRYGIVSEADLVDAAAKLDAARSLPQPTEKRADKR
jgi:hypothetical protein